MRSRAVCRQASYADRVHGSPPWKPSGADRGARDRVVEHRAHRVVEQRRHRAVRGVPERQLLAHGEHAHDVARGHRHRVGEEASYAAAHRHDLLGRGHQHAQVDPGIGGHQRRPALHDVLAVRLLDDARHPLDREVGETALLDRAGGVRDGLLHDGRQRALQRLDVAALADDGAVVVDDPHRHPQVLRQRLRRPRVVGHHHAGTPRQRMTERVEQPALPRLQRLEHGAGGVGHGHERGAQVLGQAADERGDHLLAAAGHLPEEVLGVHLRQQRDRQLDGHAVVAVPGLEGVLEGKLGVEGAERPAPREGLVEVVARLAHEEPARIGQQVRRFSPSALPPPVERPAVADARRQPLVEELDEHLVVDEQVATPHPVLELGDLRHQLGVVAREAVMGVPLAGHQRVPDEQVARDHRVDAAVLHTPTHHQRHAVQRDPLVGDHAAPLLRPARLGVAALHEVAGDRLDRLGVDPGGHAPEQPRGLHELGGHGERRRLARQRRPGVDRPARTTGAEVVAPSPGRRSRRG